MPRIYRFAILLSVLLVSTLSALASEQPSPETVQSATTIREIHPVDRAFQLIGQRKKQDAKKILLSYIESQKDRPIPPYVSEGIQNAPTLHCYVNSQADVLAFSALIDNAIEETQQTLKKLFPWAIELRKKHPWQSIIFEKPYLPQAHHYLAYIAIEEKDFQTAIGHLERAIEIWPDYTAAHVELVYLLIQKKQFGLAKERGKTALENFAKFDRDGRARLLRHLGYIAIEENELETAEDYFNQCLKINKNDAGALNELKYIQQLREKNKAIR